MKFRELLHDSNSRQRLFQSWLLVFIIAFISGLIGHLYAEVVYEETAASSYQGLRTGFSIGLMTSIFEVFYIRSRRRSWFRRAAFLPGLIVRILILTLLIRVGLVGNQILSGYLQGETSLTSSVDVTKQFRDTVFGIALVVIFVVLSQLTATIGAKRFFYFVVGRYFKPVSENRVFLFVDLVGSSDLAHKLGNVRFHEYLAEFFYQLDYSVVRFGGEIVSYVGDAVIVTWPLTEDKSKNAACLLALRNMVFDMDIQAESFLREFGEKPVFRAALHGGEVVIGECGDSRKQITFLGDVLNTTARIEAAAKEENEQYLISDKLVEQLDVPKDIQFKATKPRNLKGVKESILLHQIVFS